MQRESVVGARGVVVDIVAMDAGGDGIARHRGRRLLVPFTIPGERVRVDVARDRETAGLVEVLRPSPHRVTAPCPHFGPFGLREERGCGGCTWQHIAYAEQLRLKTDLVTRLVREIVPHAPAATPMLAATPIDDPWGYRHKVHFVFGTTRTSRRPQGHPGNRGNPGNPGNPGNLVMGHYARGSRRVVPVRVCPVHDERGNGVAFALRDALVTGTERRPSNDPTLRGVAIRAGFNTAELMTTLVVSSDADRAVRSATRRFLDAHGAATAFHVNVHPRDDGFIFGRETRRITGPERMREAVAGASFLISPTAFFQTNVAAAEILVRLVLEAIETGPQQRARPAEASKARRRVLDLYAGAGLFAIPLAKAGHEVVAVEENRSAVADGEASLRLNRVATGQCRFVASPVERFLRRDRGSGGREGDRFDAVILDPPREGCEAGVVDTIFGAMRPPHVVYVSCNPLALARDLAAVVAHNYKIDRLQPVDMFPHTAHVECIATLRRSD